MLLAYPLSFQEKVYDLSETCPQTCGHLSILGARACGHVDACVPEAGGSNGGDVGLLQEWVSTRGEGLLG